MVDLWTVLKQTNKPIVLYGTGNGADKIITAMKEQDLTLSGVFASDGFVRSRIFAGLPVLSYDEAKRQFGGMIVLLAFGSHRQDVIQNIQRISLEQELYAPDVALYGNPVVFDIAYYENHKKEILKVRNMLADEKSRQVLDDVISYRLSGNLSYLFHCETSDEENWKLLQLHNHETYMDLGAYTGDTIDMFLSNVHGYDTIHAVEPDKRNFRKLQENTKNLPNCHLYKMGIGRKEEQVFFPDGKGRGGSIGKGIKVPFTSIDSILDGQQVTFLKMDVEGQEMDALLGGEKTIRRYHPKCLVSAYHRIDDLWTLPKLLKEWNPEYKFYLRHSSCVPAWEVNYYVV